MKAKLSNTIKKTPPLTRSEVKAIRCACLMRGTTFTAWIRETGINTGIVYNALFGRRNGPKANQLRLMIRQEFSA